MKLGVMRFRLFGGYNQLGNDKLITIQEIGFEVTHHLIQFFETTSTQKSLYKYILITTENYFCASYTTDLGPSGPLACRILSTVTPVGTAIINPYIPSGSVA